MPHIKIVPKHVWLALPGEKTFWGLMPNKYLHQGWMLNYCQMQIKARVKETTYFLMESMASFSTKMPTPTKFSIVRSKHFINWSLAGVITLQYTFTLWISIYPPYAAMPVLHRWDSDDASDGERTAGRWRYDETSDEPATSSGGESGEDSSLLGILYFGNKTFWVRKPENYLGKQLHDHILFNAMCQIKIYYVMFPWHPKKDVRW